MRSPERQKAQVMSASLTLKLNHIPHLSESIMVKAILNGVVIAETEKYETVEGNMYFPPESLNKDYFTDSDTQCVNSFFPRAAY